MDAEPLDRSGTSNKYPMFILGDNVNWVSSDLYVHDASYFRLKNIQLGYTLPQSLTRKAFIEKLRVYVAAENLITFTKYWGFDLRLHQAEHLSELTMAYIRRHAYSP